MPTGDLEQTTSPW